MTRPVPRRLALAGLAAAVVGCATGPTAAGDFAYAGEWTYVGSRETPSLLAYRGPLSLRAAGGSDTFEGTVVLTESAPGGAVRTLQGPVSGVVVQDSILDFTAQLGGVGRRHVGVARGDSISGTWADGSATTASGTFVLRRAGAP